VWLNGYGKLRRCTDNFAQQCFASAMARPVNPASNLVIRRAAVRDSSATLLRSSRSFAPNLGTSRGQYVLLEELDCELGDGVSSRTPRSFQDR
jgi:hypothetical protein